MLSDAHCHFFSDRFFAALGTQKGFTSATPDREVTSQLGWTHPGDVAQLADIWVAELDRHNVSRVALIASIHGDEESVAAAVERHPTRFVGFFMLDPTAADAESRIERAVARPSLRCVCLFPAMHRYSLTDSRVGQVVTRLASRAGMALFVHCGVLSVGVRQKLGLPSKFEMRFGNPLDVQGLALAHPDMPVILPHFGAGLLREALMLAEACPNVHLDTSSSNRWMRFTPGLTLRDVFASALDVLGPKRLLFGTDSSFFPRGWQKDIHQRQHEVVSGLGLPADDVEAVFGGNFDRLFRVT